MKVPILGFAARSGSGKTTLLVALIPMLRDRGLRCGVIKHSHHDVDLDRPGKDTHRLREAGASQLLLASPHRCFWVDERDGISEPTLDEALAGLQLDRLDLVLVEGFKDAAIPKIEINRPRHSPALLCSEDDRIIALATDAAPREPCGVPVLPLNDVAAIADFVIAWTMRARTPAGSG